MKSSPLKIAIIGSLLVIIFALIMHFTGNSYNKAVSYITYLIVVGTIVMSIYLYKKNDMNDSMSFREGFWAGMQATLIFAVIGCIWMVVYIKVVNPEFMSVMKQMQMDEMIKRGMTDDQMEKALPMMEKFMSLPFMIVSALVMYSVFGAITSLITSAILKNRSSNELPTQ